MNLARTAARFARVPGLLLAGYGGLVLLRVLAHEDPLVGLLLLVMGAALLAWAPSGTPAAAQEVPRGHRVATFAVGAVGAGGVLAYNLAARSDLTVPELAILVYGLLLLAAAPRLDARVGRMRVASLVAWSLPLAAAPLAMYALDAALDAGVGASPLDAFIRHALVAPMAWTLHVLGFDVRTFGQTLMLGTPRGSLALTVGLVCAGLQPGVLFMGVLGLHAWRERTPPPRLALYLGLGLAGVYLANLVRLVALALVGHQWGGAALQSAHAHLGWLLFVGWMLAFWAIVLRRFEGHARPRNV